MWIAAVAPRTCRDPEMGRRSDATISSTLSAKELLMQTAPLTSRISV